MAGSEGRHPVEDYQSLRKELRLYDPMLVAKASCVVANKMDLPGAEENLEAFRTRFPKLTVVPVCAELGEGSEGIVEYLAEKVAE
jgi:GTP-binding protein